MLTLSFCQVTRALEWLRPDERYESRRLGASLLLRELAAAAPTVFNVHVSAFVDAIWTALRDPRPAVREAARGALRECLCVVEARETRYRVQWYYQLYEACQAGLGRDARPVDGVPPPPPRPEVLHASLLAFGELLRHTGEFMLARYREVTETILRYRDHRDKCIRAEVIRLLPRVAAFSPARFARSYLPGGATHLLAATQRAGEKGAALCALGELASALSEEEGAEGSGAGSCLAPYLGDVAAALNEALTAPPRRREAVSEALVCCGAMAQHAGPGWGRHARQLLPPLFALSLQQPLVDALAATAQALPELLAPIQERLLAALSTALAARGEQEGGGPAGGSACRPPPAAASAAPGAAPGSHVAAAPPPGASGEAASRWARREEVRLALHTLGSFDFRGRPLLGLARRCVAPHLEDADPEARRAAALAAVQLLRRRGAVRPSPPEAALVERLLSAAVVDGDSGVRGAVLQALLPPSGVLDAHLAQAEALRTLFLALNDEAPHCRAAAARLVGRLAPRNAAHVLPALRRHLLQLLVDVEHGADSAVRQEAATLLGVLVAACPRLVVPYVPPLMRALVAKLRVDAPPPCTAAGGAALALAHHAPGGGPGAAAGSVAAASGAAGGASLGAHAGSLQGGSLGSAAPAAAAAAAFASHGAANGAQHHHAGAGGTPSGVGAPPSHGERRAVMRTVGALASVGGASVAPHLPELLPLVEAALRDGGGAGAGGVRDAAVVTLGQLAVCWGGSGHVAPAASPLESHPALLDLLLALLGDGSGSELRHEVLRTLGALGALDPHTHKEQRARALGEGLLSAEGVRGTRRADGPPAGAGPGAPPAGGAAAAAVANPLQPSTTAAAPSALATSGEEGLGGELLPSAGLTTASDDFYPTIAMNALFRVLRDPQQASQHAMVARSLRYLLDALGLGVVPYLPRVLPALAASARSGAGDEALRELLLGGITALVGTVRAHVRPFLPELLPLCYELWDDAAAQGAHALLPALLRLLEAVAGALQDEFRPHLADVLPRCVALLSDAERSRNFQATPHVLHALESFGLSLEEHLRLILPALVRLIKPPSAAAAAAAAAASAAQGGGGGGGAVHVGAAQPTASGVSGGVPVSTRRAVLRTLSRLLPRLPLEAHASAVVHPLLRVLETAAVTAGEDELRRPAADALAAVASTLGPDFRLFLPTARRALAAARLQQPRFDAVARALEAGEPWVAPPPAPPPAPLPLTGGEPPDAAPQSGRTTPRGGSALGGPSSLPPCALGGRLCVDEAALKKAWESSQRSTKEDWIEWQRHLAVEQLRNSPSPALRACLDLATVQPHIARDLFAAAFASCWAELPEHAQEALSHSLESALASPAVPPAIVTTLLNLAEFMEHDERALPLDARTLGAHAVRCRAFAKALRYKEQEFAAGPGECVEALIAINNSLGQPEAAAGVLVHAQARLKLEIKEEWYEALGRWEAALESYEKRSAAAPRGSPARSAATSGRMRCLAALAEWDQLAALAAAEWPDCDEARRGELAPVAARAAWHLGAWEALEQYAQPLRAAGRDAPEAHHTTATSGGFHRTLSLHSFAAVAQQAPSPLSLAFGVAPPDGAASSAHGDLLLSTDGDFYRAVLAVRCGDHVTARRHVEAARELLATELAALVGESYERAYGGMVRVQQLSELEEVMAYSASGGDEAPAKQAQLRAVWRRRLAGTQRSADVWQALLSVRSLVLPPDGDGEDAPTWTAFAALQRKAGAPRAARRTLLRMLHVDPASALPGAAALPGRGSGGRAPDVVLAYLKHLWATGYRTDALSRMDELVDELRGPAAAAAAAASAPDAIVTSAEPGDCKLLPMSTSQLFARASLRLGAWRWEAAGGSLDDASIAGVLSALRAATDADRGWSKAWHMWGLFNAAAMEHYAPHAPSAAARHVAPAVTGFFRSIALASASRERSKGGTHLQDILRLLTLWFAHGAAPDVEAALQKGFSHVSIDTWLAVIPQIVARIHSSSLPVRHLIHSLLVRVGRHHPQALLYPVLVASKSQSSARRSAANAVLEALRGHAGALVAQAQLVSKELIRVAITWHETWHEALEEASRLYFGESNVEGMLAVLAPLHAQLEKGGAETLQEAAFVAAYGRELCEAHEWCLKYRSSPASSREVELNNAWDLYYHVFKRINKQLPTLTQLELAHVSPRLLQARDLELAVPGNYLVGAPLVTIASFAPTLHVITSKQRPRKLSVHGSDGKVYGYLLKGHEDLRQDERVMQLFGLVNMLLAHDARTAARDLAIARYAVVPLSPNSGLIGWVPNCDTLHALIREHRDAHKVPLNLEHRLMLAMAPDYDQLPLMAKVEVFEHALANTAGDDIARVLWLRSRSSEVWLERRTAFTRSLAVMSMVGYLLGLGDRHPSNLMLDRYSGKILHIDFGDCFEASQNREKFPEKVPFRLTRMLVNAMEACGIEGNFRATAEAVVGVLRSNKDSVMAMLEAFVHDPLINWRLLQAADAGTLGAAGATTPTAAPTTPTQQTGAQAQAFSGEAAPFVVVPPRPSTPPPSGAMAPQGAAHTSPVTPTGPGAALPPLGKAASGRVLRRSSTSALALAEAAAQTTPVVSTTPLAQISDSMPSSRPLIARRGSLNAAVLEEAAAAAAGVLTPVAPGPPVGASRARRPSMGAAAMAAAELAAGKAASGAEAGAAVAAAAVAAEAPLPGAPSPPQRAARERELKDVFYALGDANEVLNERAVSVMRRMAAKLTGRDGGLTGAEGAADSIEAQVQRLIGQATSNENLCQSYIGWCAFW